MKYDIFVHNKTMEKARLLKENGLYPFFRPIENTEGTIVHVHQQYQIMIGSNNYLGLTHHPYVKECAQKAIERYGTGCTGSRFLNGNLELHEELEEKLAKFLNQERALVFATGMQANLGAVSALCRPRDCIIADFENHASLIDAARLSHATGLKFKHNNMESLRQVLEEHRRTYKNAWIVVDGVFSMTGDIIDLPNVCQLAKEFDCFVYLDDAHSLGVLGPQGKGTLAHFGLTSKTDVDVCMGTFSKSFASVGGVVSGPAEVIDYIRHSARSFIFSASMPPAAVATVLACLKIIQEDSSILKKLWENVAFMNKGLKDIGVYTYNSKTPIIPILVGDDLKAMQVTKFLEENHVFATPVISPAVPKEEALIRTSYMASHSRKELEQVLEVIKKAKQHFNLPSSFNKDKETL